MEEWWVRYWANLDGTRTSAEVADIFIGSLEGWKIGEEVIAITEVVSDR